MELFAILLVPLLLAVAVPHELAHLLAARRLGIGVLEFGLGLPPAAVAVERWGIRWSVCWLLPLGAFVRLKGESGGDQPDDFAARPARQQALVLLAGPLANLVVAALAAGIFLAVYGQPKLPHASLQPTAGVVGWLGLAQVMNELAPLGIPPAGWFLALLACLSLGLGASNLLPLLPLDGGRLALAVVGSWRQRLTNPQSRHVRLANVTGLVLLVGVMLAVNAVDLARFVQGQPVLVAR